MLDYFVTIDPADIRDMTSASPNRIYLPYINTGEVCYHAEEMIADYIGQTGKYPDNAEGDKQLSDDCTRILDGSTIRAYLMLQPSHTEPRAGLVIDVDLPDGQRLHRSVFAPSESGAAAEIITQFLVAGAPGLCADVRRSYERQHRAFTERWSGTKA